MNLIEKFKYKNVIINDEELTSVTWNDIFIGHIQCINWLGKTNKPGKRWVAYSSKLGKPFLSSKYYPTKKRAAEFILLIHFESLEN